MPILAHLFEVNSRDIDNAIAVMLESFIQSQKHQVPRLLGAIALYWKWWFIVDLLIENGDLSWIYPLNMVIFHSYVNIYQRV